MLAVTSPVTVNVIPSNVRFGFDPINPVEFNITSISLPGACTHPYTLPIKSPAKCVALAVPATRNVVNVPTEVIFGWALADNIKWPEI